MDEETLRWCKRLIGCRSVTGEGTREIVELCTRELLRPHGIDATLIDSAVEGASQVNLLAKVPGRDSSLAPIVLNTHLDTVPPGDSALWSECPDGPFVAAIKDDRIYGLGAADTKLDFVAKSLALIECTKPRRDVYLVATFGEEHGLVGAKELARKGLLPRGALAYVGEPSRLQVITAHKGLMVFRLEVEFQRHANPAADSTSLLTFAGRSAHSSTPALGINAIGLALAAAVSTPEIRLIAIDGGDAVNKVPAKCDLTIAGTVPSSLADVISAKAKLAEATATIPSAAIGIFSSFTSTLAEFVDSSGPAERDYAAPTLTCNPGIIRTSAELIALDFELRPPPSMPLDEVREGVTHMVEGLLGRSHGTRINLRELRANPGFRSAFEGETVELAMAALAGAQLPLESGVKAGCTEAGIYAAAGLRPVVFGPGPSTGVIHAPNEYNFISDVEGALRFYCELLKL